MMDKNRNFPSQLTDGDPDECVALTVTDLAGNIDGRLYNPDFTYAGTIFLEGVLPGEQGTNPWVGLQSAIAYGLLPVENTTFTAKTMSELYASNWANYGQPERQVALTHQFKAPKNIGKDYSAVVTFMQQTGWGVMLPLTWYSSFLEAPNGMLPTPTGRVNLHCVAAYLDEDGTTILIKPWLGPTYGKGGYAILTKEMFTSIVNDCFSFDPNGNHWYAILAILLTKFPYLKDAIPTLLNAQTFNMLDNQTPNPDALFTDWTIQSNAHHNVRALCDLEGLNYDQKQILTACVREESNFLPGAEHPNYVLEKVGEDASGKPILHRKLSSTDYGIVQINDYWHIGPGKDFPSVEYVLTNPEVDVRWMCRYYKQHGHLNAWVSYTSGAYKQYLGKV